MASDKLVSAPDVHVEDEGISSGQTLNDDVGLVDRLSQGPDMVSLLKKMNHNIISSN